ncbi:MAG: hypothetical protein H2058_13145 [Muricauda sp.]|nr:hypothetical protein [Allomuricauda sp.]MBA4746195.1 hypothetical protein [Allomuricauda sp.]
MKNGTYTLREKPKFEIDLSDNSIKIVNKSKVQSSSSFILDKIETFEIKERRTNWLITILSFVVEIFSSISVPGKYSEGSQLLMEYEGNTFKYYLNDCDLKLLSEIQNKLQNITQ